MITTRPAPTLDFTSVRNSHEGAVFREVERRADDFPVLGGDADLLADVACVALNQLAPRYIRHAADLAFYTTPSRREAHARDVADAVDHAFGYVQARHLMAARR